MASRRDCTKEIASSHLSTSRRNPSALLVDFIRSFERTGAAVSSKDAIFLKELVLSCDIIADISEDLYLEILCFLADNWVDCFAGSFIGDVPIVKYLNQYGKVTLCNIGMSQNGGCKICIPSDYKYGLWLCVWNNELKGASDIFFLPESTLTALERFPKRKKLSSWIHEQLGIEDISVHDFSYMVLCNLKKTNDRDLIVGFTHFLCSSLSKGYLTEEFVSALCESMPVVDKRGKVIVAMVGGALVPASASKWVELAGTSLWTGGSYTELGEDYLHRGYFSGERVEKNSMLAFLQRFLNALDIPEVYPPDADLPTASSPLSGEHALLLLEWIKKATTYGIGLPGRFLKSIKEGKWLKTSLGFKSPSESFLPTSQWGSLLCVGSAIEDIPLVDEKFYGSQITAYRNELNSLGVVSDVEECCLFTAYRLISATTTSTLTKDSVISLLRLIRYMAEKNIAYEEIMRSIREEKWLMTSKGCRSPLGAIMFNVEWEVFQQIADLPFVDEAYYGKEICCYENELKLLGVAVGFDKSYELIIENFRLPACMSALTVNSFILILECIRHTSSSSHFIDTLREQEWIKTDLGYRSPNECFLFDSGWGCILRWSGVPVIDESFYGNHIRSYVDELKGAGVPVAFEDACNNAINHVKLLLHPPSLTKQSSISLLQCCKQLRANGYSLFGKLRDCISQENWLKTRLGFRSPSESAIYGYGWEPLSRIADIPFLDASYYGESIYSYVDELSFIGVTTDACKAFLLLVAGFKFPKHKSQITAPVVVSLLECVKYQMDKSPEEPLPAEFLRCIRSKKWLKTCMGYSSPLKCLLYDSEWDSVLKRNDAPFIDESFYGSDIALYWKELSSIGVRVRVGSGCRLIAQCLRFHTDFSAIVRIYRYLLSFNWEPEAEEKSECWIWVPSEIEAAGEWVSSQDCVLHQEDNISNSTARVLERYYEKDLLPFFSTAFGVGPHPRSYQQK